MLKPGALIFSIALWYESQNTPELEMCYPVVKQILKEKITMPLLGNIEKLVNNKNQKSHNWQQMGRRYSKIWGFVTNPLKKPKKLCSASTLLSSFLLRNEIMGNQRNDICKNSIEEIIYVCQNPGGVFSVIN